MVCIDAHAHLALRTGALETLLQSMDRHAIDVSFVVGGGLMSPMDLSTRMNGHLSEERSACFDNAQLKNLCDTSRGRLLPFYFANPWMNGSDYIKNGAHYHGLKIAPLIHGMVFDHPNHHQLFIAAAAFGHAVYLHCLAENGFRVVDFVAVAADHPDVTFILGHAGVGNMDFMAVQSIAPFPHILFETSGGFSSVIKYAIGTLGAHRVLFGSEYPLQDPAAELLKLENLDVTDAELCLIKGGTAARVAAGVRHVC